MVISLGIRRSPGEIIGCIWECCQPNAGITIKLWEMPSLLWIFMQRTTGVIWNATEVYVQSISLNAEYDTWIIVHYHFWNIVAIIFFNNVFFTSLHWKYKLNGVHCKYKQRYTETLTHLSDWMIWINHGVNVVHYFSHLIRANESRIIQFINGAKTLEVFIGFDVYTYPPSWWNWIPMSSGSICNI